MARARNIKPGFFVNEELAELRYEDRLFFIGLWTLADFRGCIEYRPRRIKIAVMPYDDGFDVEESVLELIKSGFVRIYSVAGRRYLKIANFVKHQRPHKNEIEAGSELPDESAGEDVTDVIVEDAVKDGEASEQGPNKSEPLALNTDTLNIDTLSPSEGGETPLTKKTADTFPESRWQNPAVLYFEEIFGFKVGSQFAAAVQSKVLDLGTWKALVDNKRAFADKKLIERKRVCHWILDEYDKRVKEQENGSSKIVNFRDQRAAEAVNERNYLADLRQRYRGGNAGLLEPSAADSSRQLQPIEPVANDG